MNKPFEFNSGEKIAAMSQSLTDQVLRLQDAGFGNVNFEEAKMQAMFEIAAQLSGIREELRAQREPTLRWYRPDVLLPDTQRDVIVVLRERMRDGGKTIISNGWYDGEKWRGIGENLPVKQWTEKPL